MISQLRVADLRDRDLFAALEAEVFPEDPWTPIMIAEELSSPASRYWIATDEAGVPIGYGGVKVGADQADVMTIGVRECARGQGVGAAILDVLLAWASKAGAVDIFLDVRPSNEGAIALYKSRGLGAGRASSATLSRMPSKCAHPCPDRAQGPSPNRNRPHHIIRLSKAQYRQR